MSRLIERFMFVAFFLYTLVFTLAALATATRFGEILAAEAAVAF